MATCLVTGGAGFLGSHLCDELLKRGHRVICVDNLETGSLHNIEHIRVPEFEFRQRDIVEPFFVDEQVDFVYHLASPASPIDYLRLPLHTLKVGSYGTHHALGLAKAHRARFLTASTSEVYGDPQVHPQTEDYWGHVNPIGPRGVYDEAKRYAEALVMAYHRQQGVDTSMIRIFNSVLADEQVLYDDGTELRREPVKELAERLIGQARVAGYVPMTVPAGHPSPEKVQRSFEFGTHGMSVPAFADGGTVQSAEPTALIGHPTDERCFEVTTRYGRSVRVTGHHSIFVEGDDGEPIARPVVDLEPGDHVALMSRIEVPERDRPSVSMLEVWRRAECDPWDLTLESPGLGEQAWGQRFDLHGMLMSERPSPGPNVRNTAWTRLIRARRSGRLSLPLAARVLDGIPENARVSQYVVGGGSSLPAQVEISDGLLWLLGLWVAEGSWHRSERDAFITISCDQGTLARARSIIERELGLHVVEAPGDGQRSGSIYAHSRLLLMLFEHLGFEDGRKRIPGWILGLPQERLSRFLEGYREGDGVHSGKKLGGIRHEFSTVHEELKDDLIVAFARFGLLPSVGKYTTRLGVDGVDRPFWRLTLSHVEPFDILQWPAGVAQTLNARRTGDLVWATVTGIEEVEATELVYDFSVPGLENFWAGTGVACHNTYGSRMRPFDGRAIPTFLRQALQNAPITVFGDGSQTRSFCFVDDLIRGMILLAESGEHLPVNIGNPDEFTLLELAHAVIAVTGSTSQIIFEPLPTDDPQQRRPDITRAKELLGWEPTISLNEGLAKTLERAGRKSLIG